MRNLFGLFWLFFFLYFIFGHPAVIYYSSEYPKQYLEQVNPTESLVYLGISIVLWSGIFLVLLRIIYGYTFKRKWNINRINQTGKRLDAIIVQTSKSASSVRDQAIKSVVLQLKNLQQEPIQHQMDIFDSKPMERRFEEGKHIQLRVDPTFKLKPYVILEGTQGKINGLFFAGWLLLLSGVIYYYVFSYQLENANYGWRFLSLSHPLISSGGFLIFFAGIFYLIFKFIILKKLNLGSSSLALKFSGLRAAAVIQEVKQTGTYINEQPEVRFVVEYTDATGVIQRATVKKVVSLLDLGNIQTQRNCVVFYNPKTPNQVMFESDVNTK